MCTVDEVKAFMKTTIDWFRTDEGSQMVERWSWFGAFRDRSGDPWGVLDADGTANEVGIYYATL